MKCPACSEGEGHAFRKHSAEAAAQHFVPRERDAERHHLLVAHLQRLWNGQDFVETHLCPQCGFGFSVPWVGGDEQFYSLVHQGDPHYPDDRWEFKRTLAVLASPTFARPLRLAEVGAGHGAFLNQVRTLPHGAEHDIVAADFDRGAVQRLAAKGYCSLLGSLGDMREAFPDLRFDVVCLFQTLEHMAHLNEVFGQISDLLVPGGSVFLSVPNGQATTLQEDLTSYWDMPPNHVGRWTPTAMRSIALRCGFDVVSIETQPLNLWATTLLLALYSVNSRAYQSGTVASRINAITSRPVRGVLKRVLMASQVPRLFAQRRRYQPLACWAHLRAHA
jgi:SAM-dependent methyltransferase